MSALDQAFIKAYTPQEAVSSPARRGSRRRARGAARPAKPRHEPAPATGIPEVADPCAPSPSVASLVMELEEGPSPGPIALEAAGGKASFSEGRVEPSAKVLEDFRPAFQVDAFIWPTSVTKMGEVAGHCLDPVVDRLIVGSAQGRKVIAFEGCRRGDGCTTVLLAVARRLAERGLRVVLVDADFDHPRLARRLGLAPEVGWEAVLARRLPLAETVIDSVEDRLALLPLGEPPGREDFAVDERPDLQATMNVLRGAYDLILVDVGRLTKRSGIDLKLSEGSGRWLDAVVLVRNVRGTPETEIAQNCERLHAAGIVDVAVVENFV